MPTTDRSDAMRPTPIGGARPRRVRVALYSHDTMGIGHMRRNLLIAQALAGPPSWATVLLITGAREASAFALPSSVDCLTLPSFHKEIDGAYRARRLDVAVEKLTQLRAQAIQAALGAFEPDVLVVDKVPRGALGELGPALEMLRRRGHTRCVLGLRDVLDAPAVVRHEWSRDAANEAIRDYYDAVWVYGDAAVYDPVREYAFPAEVADKVRYTGYLDPRVRLSHLTDRAAEPDNRLDLPSGPLVLCTVGGGQDGVALAEAFVQAELPRRTCGVLLTGPFMPTEVQRRLSSSESDRRRVLSFLAAPERLLRRADAVVAMGGYNTVCEILSFEKRALIVPRVRPRCEQLIRAERLSRMGLIDLLHPDLLSPRTLSAWLASDRPPPRAHGRVDFGGLKRLPQLLSEVLGPRTSLGKGLPALGTVEKGSTALAVAPGG